MQTQTWRKRRALQSSRTSKARPPPWKEDQLGGTCGLTTSCKTRLATGCIWYAPHTSAAIRKKKKKEEEEEVRKGPTERSKRGRTYQATKESKRK